MANVKSDKPKTERKTRLIPSEHTDGMSFSDALKSFSEAFLPRTNDIVRARFGLSGSKPKTLEEIGKTYGITRERVRQILAGAFASVKQRRDDQVFVALSERIESAVGERSGIVSVDELFRLLPEARRRRRGRFPSFSNA